MAAEIYDETSDIPEIFYDATCQKTYKRIKFHGKSTFGKCYKIVDAMTNQSFAGKIISKKLVMNHKQKKKLSKRITIHRSLNHPNVVKCHSFFEDSFNMYIVLELCKNRSMDELHKRRRTITEYECRYYMYQIINGVKYLHDNHIVHRDLKLSNLFLNDSLHVKIGNFGVATRIKHEGERKNTLCGTLNCIAPEIITEKCHSYEVDIWSIGCVMYTLLVGEPPFATYTLEGICEKIMKFEYLNVLGKSAADMIKAMLQINPEHRPTIGELLSFDFLRSDSVPSFLPTSCLAMAPRMELSETMENYDDIRSLKQQIANILNANPPLLPDNLVGENTDPDAQPLYWISKWWDYSYTYGFGYQLCDESVGVVFNDNTKLISLPNQIDVHYIDAEGRESYMTTENYSETLEDKMITHLHYKCYWTENLDRAKGNSGNSVSDQISRIPYLHGWYKTQSAVVMQLINGTVQLHFTNNMNILLCPRMSSVTYIDYKKNLRTCRFSTIIHHGLSMDSYQKICYAYKAIDKMP